MSHRERYLINAICAGFVRK